MKKLTFIIMLLFLSACNDGEPEQVAVSEADNSSETIEDTTDQVETNEKVVDAERTEEIRKEERKSEKNATVDQDDPDMSVREFSYEEKQEMTQAFYDWAIERAEIGKMAVTTRFFEHGAGGIGDWYALTPDGEVQAQNHNNPGFDNFNIHAIGGVAFYQPLSEDYGVDESAPTVGFAEGYSRLAKPNTNIHKYMLADNGIVYELIAKKENMSFSTGFGEYADDGAQIEFKPAVQFEISKDQDAQEEWGKILKSHQNN